MKKSIGMFAIALAIVLTVPAGAAAQDVKQRTLRFGHSLSKDHPLGQGAQRFADLVSQKSGGNIKVSIFPGAVLGSDPQNLSAVRGGTLDIATMATGLLVGLDKQFMIFDFPFLFNDAQEAFAVADGPVGKKLMDELPKYGIVGLGIWDLGFRNITNSRRPIQKVEDIQGLKLRVIQTPIYIDMFSTLGANPVPMTFGELYNALETRTVDGQENPVGVIESAKFAEVQKYLSVTKHTYTAMPILFSKKTWDSMSEAERKIIVDAANEAKEEERKISLAREREGFENLRKTMQVNDVPPQEMAKFRDKVKPVIDKYSKEVGEPMMQEVDRELTRIRGGRA